VAISDPSVPKERVAQKPCTSVTDIPRHEEAEKRPVSWTAPVTVNVPTPGVNDAESRGRNGDVVVPAVAAGAVIPVVLIIVVAGRDTVVVVDRAAPLFCLVGEEQPERANTTPRSKQRPSFFTANGSGIRSRHHVGIHMSATEHRSRR
jgi:hypothetical protein